ncbi:MAG: 16S rRNA (cytosine(1402)-N(4))-methyltransferase RsmH [Pseudomonadota bacterium]
MGENFNHVPVMLREVLQTLSPQGRETYVDGTMGGGGYTRAILDAAPQCNVIAFDRDQAAHAHAQKWSAPYEGRLKIVHGDFGRMYAHLQGLGVEKVDGIVLDLGVSSPQIDEAERGFSFRESGPLDMRMDQSQGETAADLCNTLPEAELANLIYAYGEEKLSRRIAKAIVAGRPLTTTAQLATIVASVVSVHPRDTSHPATRTFQALRIAVNHELDQLQQALNACADLLKPDGRLVVVSFHSLEDRIVKTYLAAQGKPPAAQNRYTPVIESVVFVPTFRILTKSPLSAAPDECKANPRSRSAKLRAAVRLADKVVAA